MASHRARNMVALAASTSGARITARKPLNGPIVNTTKVPTASTKAPNVAATAVPKRVKQDPTASLTSTPVETKVIHDLNTPTASHQDPDSPERVRSSSSKHLEQNESRSIDIPEEDKFPYIGVWDIDGWKSAGGRSEAPCIDYLTADRLPSPTGWYSIDVLHWTTMDWMLSPAHDGLPDTLTTSTETPFHVGTWPMLKGRSANVWPTNTVQGIQRIWDNAGWGHAMAAADVRDLITDLHKEKDYVLRDLYQEVFIRGTCPWSQWWSLSKETTFKADSSSTRKNADELSSIITIKGPTRQVRMHPLIGTLGGIFDGKGCKGVDGAPLTQDKSRDNVETLIQTSDGLGRPFRAIPSDYDVNSFGIATHRDGTHFITVGALNLKDAHACMLAGQLQQEKITSAIGSKFQILCMDSFPQQHPGLFNCLIQTFGLISSCCSFMERKEGPDGYLNTSSVSMSKLSSLHVAHCATPHQILGNTCALHAACNLQRLVAVCRSHTDSWLMGNQLPWFPDAKSWIERCQKKDIFGSFPVEAACTLLHVRKVILAKIGRLPGGKETKLYKCLHESIMRMTQKSQAGLHDNKFVDVCRRMTMYKQHMCTQFGTGKERTTAQNQHYIL